MDTKKLIEIENALRNEHVWCEDIWFQDDKLCVYVDGDWKHDHLRCDWILAEDFNFYLDSVEMQGESDDDSYEAIRRYVFVDVKFESVDDAAYEVVVEE